MAAVTFSGFNNIDFSQVVTAIMQQEGQPVALLQTQKSTFETQKTAFGTLASKLSSLESAIAGLANETSAIGLTASSSDAGVGVSTTAGTIEGSYDVVVSQIARRQVTASTGTYGSTDAIVGTSGALTFTSDGATTSVTISASTTIQQLVKAINADENVPVTASLVQSTPGSYQLVLTSKTTGADNAFTFTSSLAGGTGVTFKDLDANNIYGDVSTDNVRNAADALFTVNGLPITSTTNSVSEVIPGVTLSLDKEDATKTVTVKVTRDSSDAKDRLKTLISSYNDLVSFFTDQRTLQTNNKANISRDPLLRHLRDALRSTMMDEHANSGGFTRLAEVGLGFDSSGKMTLDEEVLDSALAANSADVQSLFAGDDGASGAFGAMKEAVQTFTGSGGLVTDARDRLTEQVKRTADRIDLMNQQLERRKSALQKEFAAADQAMTQLNAAVASLSSLGGEYRLF